MEFQTRNTKGTLGPKEPLILHQAPTAPTGNSERWSKLKLRLWLQFLHPQSLILKGDKRRHTMNVDLEACEEDQDTLKGVFKHFGRVTKLLCIGATLISNWVFISLLYQTSVCRALNRRSQWHVDSPAQLTGAQIQIYAQIQTHKYKHTHWNTQTHKSEEPESCPLVQFTFSLG